VAVVDDLKRVPLFADLNQRQLRKLGKCVRERVHEPGISVVQEGQMSGVGFFIIAEGEATVNAGGRDIATLGAGDYFGELALISEGERAATVSASTRVRLLEIPSWDFRDFALQNPDVTWKLLQHVVELLSAQQASRTLAEP
jgi:CRP-like cAMP-binding protein